MEEAETLADRIMIVKHGELITIGNTMQLKSRFNSKYTVNLSFGEGEEEQIMEYLRDVIPKKDMLEAKVHSTTVNFSTTFESVRAIFKLMEENEEFVELVETWEFHETSLSDIFLSLVEENNHSLI